LKKIIVANLIFFLLFATQSCEKKMPEKSKLPPENNKELPVLKNDSDIKTVKDFLNWYKTNQEKLYQFQCIKGGILSENETTQNYYIDFQEVDKEVKFLSDSKLFTKDFLNQYRQKYVDGAEYFKQNPQNDGPPYGFDYDYFFMTQDDYEPDLKNISKIKFDSAPKDKSTNYVSFHLDICGMTYRYTLKKEAGDWRIDKIENKS